MVRVLQSYEPRLRVRWSDFRKCWSIEEKVIRTQDLEEPITEGPVEEHTTDPDVFIRYRNGCRAVAYCVGTNPYKILDILVLADMRMWDGKPIGKRKASELIRLREDAKREAAQKNVDFLATEYGKKFTELMTKFLGKTVSWKNGRGQIVTAEVVHPLEAVSGERPARQ